MPELIVLPPYYLLLILLLNLASLLSDPLYTRPYGPLAHLPHPTLNLCPCLLSPREALVYPIYAGGLNRLAGLLVLVAKGVVPGVDLLPEVLGLSEDALISFLSGLWVGCGDVCHY